MKFKVLLFTAFYSGYSPIAPGTAGTLVGMLIYFIEYLIFGAASLNVHLVLVLVMIYPSIKLGDAGEKYFGEKDPSPVVLDEVMGYWISVLFHPFNWKIAIIAFFVFRIFDIIKPYPARTLENLKGGLGIMLDDYVAGLYTNFFLFGIIFLSKYLNVPILQ